MNLRIFTDGGSLNNPGEAASAYVIYLDDRLLLQHGEKIGIATNNTAEYTALIRALEQVKELKTKYSFDSISVTADSELMIRQLNGMYKVKHPDIRSFFMQVKNLEQEIQIPISYTHTLREGNKLADSLVKKALGR